MPKSKININPKPGKIFKVPKPKPVRQDLLTRPARPPRKVKSEDKATFKRYQGKKVTDIEANYIQVALEDPNVDGLEVQPTYVAQRGMPGSFTPDVLVNIATILYPLFLDGKYWHRTPEAIARDKRQEQQLDEILADSGASAYLAQRVPGDDVKTLTLARIAHERMQNGYYLKLADQN